MRHQVERKICTKPQCFNEVVGGNIECRDCESKFWHKQMMKMNPPKTGSKQYKEEYYSASYFISTYMTKIKNGQEKFNLEKYEKKRDEFLRIRELRGRLIKFSSRCKTMKDWQEEFREFEGKFNIN